MKKINIFTWLMAVLFLAGCDYNDKYFDGYDNIKIEDIAQYEGEFAGTYPSEGYFSDRSLLQTAIDKMLKDTFLYVDKGSTAKISVMFGDITPGFSAADKVYTLTAADYDSMGEENGQPGKYDNFDNTMDIDGYLIDLLGRKFPSEKEGIIISVSYSYYQTGASTTVRTNSYKKEISGWYKTELNSFTTDMTYKLDSADYRSMGTGYGEPGQYYNFNANMDIDMYLTNFLRIKFPYIQTGKTSEVSYLYYAGGDTTTQSRIYINEGISWAFYNPYGETVEVTNKIAEMEFDGTNWILKRLLGGSQRVPLQEAEYAILVDWVKVNKSSYMKDDRNEFYFGASTEHKNINNSYSNWKSNDPNGEYGGLNNDALQKLMDQRLATGIIDLILPQLFPTPDSGLSYNVVYNIYGGRGRGDYMMSFMYSETDKKFELVSEEPVAL